MATELAERFSRKQWKDCCGKGCKKCEIARAYIGAYGKQDGLEALNEDRVAVGKGKGSGKTKGDGKKAKGDGKKAKGDGKKAKGDGKKAKAGKKAKKG